MDTDGGIDVQTVNILYDGRKTKLELDEKYFSLRHGLKYGGIKSHERNHEYHYPNSLRINAVTYETPDGTRFVFPENTSNHSSK